MKNILPDNYFIININILPENYLLVKNIKKKFVFYSTQINNKKHINQSIKTIKLSLKLFNTNLNTKTNKHNQIKSKAERHILKLNLNYFIYFFNTKIILFHNPNFNNNLYLNL